MTDPSAVTIRRATAADVPFLLPLLEALFALETDFDFDAAKADAGLRALLGAPGATILVAERGLRVVGMVTLQELQSTAEGGPAGLVEDFVVADGARGTGVGRRLAQALADEARARGYTRLQLLADRRNEAALEFYRRQGWHGTELVALRLRL